MTLAHTYAQCVSAQSKAVQASLHCAHAYSHERNSHKQDFSRSESIWFVRLRVVYLAREIRNSLPRFRAKIRVENMRLMELFYTS